MLLEDFVKQNYDEEWVILKDGGGKKKRKVLMREWCSGSNKQKVCFDVEFLVNDGSNLDELYGFSASEKWLILNDPLVVQHF